MQLFDETKLFYCRQKAALHFSKYDFLAKFVEEELVWRLQTFNQIFEKVLIRGIRTSIIPDSLKKSKITFENCFHQSGINIKDPEPSLNIDTNCFDLVIDCLTLHTVNDIPGLLANCKQRLAKDGVYLAALFGGETLRELRESLLNSEIELSNGAALRIIPMIDLATSLALLQNCGFQEPIADLEKIEVSYTSFIKLLQDIRGMGEHHPFLSPPAPLSYLHFRWAEKYFHNHYLNDQGLLKSTVEVIYLHGMQI